MKRLPGIILIVLGVILLGIGIYFKTLQEEIFGLSGNELLSIGSFSIMTGLLFWYIFNRANIN